MRKTFLFDLDGTLIDTPPLIISTFVETFEHFFKDLKFDYETLTTFLGQTLFKTFRNYTDDEELVDQMVSYYRKKSEEKINSQLNAFDNAVKTLKTLKEQGHNVGIVTSKMKAVATSHLDKTGLLPYVDLVIGYEDVIEHKPSPEGLLKAVDYFNAEKERTYYVGDHEHDLLSAKNADIKAILVAYSLRLIEGIKTNPDLVISDLFDLTEM
ncbi:MAG: HAD-IA family hydrolase [Acholeplasmataceae bacterium]